MKNLYFRIRKSRLINRGVINLRYIIGIGFIPSGLIKLVNKPFTNPENTGVFAEFLHAFYDTGFYYNSIGFFQLLAGVLLITQRFATLGAFIFLPIILNIAILTLSTIGSLTPVIATLMLLGIVFLLLWDLPKWINIFRKDQSAFSSNWAGELPTYNSIDNYTGLALLLLPTLLLLLRLKQIFLLSVPLVMLLGNILSLVRYPLFNKSSEV